MKIYTHPRGTNNVRTKIYLDEKGVDVPLEVIDILHYAHKTDEFLKIHPLGRLPVMELDDGTIITESMAICRYVEEMHPEHPMFGTTPLEKAQIEMWNRRIELEVYIYISAILRNTQPFFKRSVHQVPEYVEACRKTVQDRFEWLDGIIGDTEFLAGDTYTVADVTACATFLMLPQLEIEIPKHLTNLQTYVDRVTSRPSAAEHK
jgi:glutathione S-transferase